MMHLTRNLARLVFALILVSGQSVPAADAPEVRQATDGPVAAPQAQTRFRRGGRRLYRHVVIPHWIEGNDAFWYRNDLKDGKKEFVFVDANKGTRELAFDHSAVATALGESATAEALPIDSLEYASDGTLVALLGNGKRYPWDAAKEELSGAAQEPTLSDEASAAGDGRPGSPPRGEDSSVVFINQLKTPAEIFWVNAGGGSVSYGKIAPGARRDQHTFGGHRWLIRNAKGESLGVITARDQASEVVIDGRKFEPQRPRRRRPRGSGQVRRNSGRSPDGKWTAAIEGYNVALTSTESGETQMLSTDGDEDLGYERVTWAPDSSTIISFRRKRVETAEVHLVRSSPKQGGRAKLESRPYALPGDPFPTCELNLFNVETAAQTKPSIDPFESAWQRPRLRFSQDGKRFTYQQIDRGHSRFRLIEVDLLSGETRNIIDEVSKTFIWTIHTETNSPPIVSWLGDSEQLIYGTEKNGWRQLILVDGNSGEEIRELTPRGIVVRSIKSIDLETRTIWITASSRSEQDPYFVHFARVDMESGELTWLTEGNGTHAIAYSPNNKYIIDTYSRVDMPPVNELRRVADGKLVCELERSDATGLEASGWVAPEVFSAKGRDGTTDIWGLIYRPRDFDPSRSYPVIEDIYAGPQGSFVPKSFSTSTRYRELTGLGFIVVKIDGMGTANRSKAFHDVCFENLKDAGFPDRILWMQAAAKVHPELDLSKVGVYGVSAGGQNAGGAVLFHPEFYKVAVAGCGCHDNRMDKASWNEQWMGYPVGPHYGESSNIDNAHRLQGNLLLIVGEMDTNVPPESTLRFADALIRADKDFDLLVVPNAGHGIGGAYGQRRMRDFFVEHLRDAD